ncbi:F-box and leucine-rich repeat protein 13-like isoform X3 [Saccostrea echinata]|uniref:F-box and leucine-rich repeat protein 13-like isoform X3 n=1 Tax=Saccostrea echinata TaxID=191078 RepID=UPI002A7F0570|nr:F-box and leucine-rich repeat protein 13-like isoform X3 [Saccostrea echinata]
MANMAASMKGQKPELKFYLRSNKLPDIYEALLTGLAVMCPDDPLQFILDKLRALKENGMDELNWDMFVEEHMKPPNKVITESNLEFIFNLDDESMIDFIDIPVNIQRGQGYFGGRFEGITKSRTIWPTPEMYATAYGHYNMSLKNMCFSAWMQYYLHKKKKKRAMEKKMQIAALHHAHRILRVHLNVWRDWLRYRKGCQAMAYHKLKRIYFVSVGIVLFREWRAVAKRNKDQREYFERLERGENVDDEETFGQGDGDAQDKLSGQLGIELAVKVFSFLDIADLARCACVCRSWKVIAYHSSLWNRLDFSKVRNRLAYGVTDMVTTKLLSKCRPYLIHLSMRGCSQLRSPTFMALSECRNLQDLNLSECKGLDDESLKLVVKGCKIILYLNLSHTFITDASLRTISKYCHNVQYMSLAYCKKFSDRGLQYLSAGKCSKKLEYLDLSGCLQITPDGFKSLSHGCTMLQTLILNEFPTLNDDCMIAIAAKCTKINTLSILGSPLLTDETFKRLANNRHIKKLRIEGNQRISDLSLKAIGKNCTDLEHLYLADCQRLTDASLKAIANCSKLVVCNIADVVQITNTGVQNLAEGTCAASLRELNLTNCIRVGDMAMFNIRKFKNLVYLSVCFCEHISEKSGIELLGQLHALVSLDISGCNCSDEGLSSLGKYNNHLRDVTLSECADITDLGLQKFTQQCKDIERLDLSHCKLLTDGAIKNLAFCCRYLTSLNLAGCKLITNLSIQYLSGVCHHLHTLDISGCIIITDKALKYLRKGCKKLKYLTMLYCKGVTKHAAMKMMRHVPALKYSDDEIPIYYGYK